MAKNKKLKSDVKADCSVCAYNEGLNEKFNYMFHCSFLNYCHNSYKGCEAERLGKGKFKEKK